MPARTIFEMNIEIENFKRQIKDQENHIHEFQFKPITSEDGVLFLLDKFQNLLQILESKNVLEERFR